MTASPVHGTSLHSFSTHLTPDKCTAALYSSPMCVLSAAQHSTASTNTHTQYSNPINICNYLIINC